jgi:C4-dicarboxylate transporter
MKKWYEILIAGSVVAVAILFFRLDDVEPLFGKIFAYVGVAILPAAFFQIRNTEKVKRVKTGDLIDKEEAATHVAWYYALLFNTALVIFVGMILSLVYWIIMTSLDFELDKPL